MDSGTVDEQVIHETKHDASNRTHEDQGRFELLVLSEAGKPVYSYTKREDAVTLMPLCSALIDYANKVQKETLKSIKTPDGLVINFANRSPLIIIVINEATSYIDPRMLVEQVEAQIVSILTAKYIRSLFDDRPTFDLKQLLYVSEKLIDATTNLCAFPKKLRPPWVEAFIAVSTQDSSLTGAGTSNLTPNPGLALPPWPHRVLIPVVIIPPNIRDNIHNFIHNSVSTNSKNVVFTLLFRIVNARSDNINDDIVSEASGDLSEHEDITEGTGNQRARDDDVSGFELLTVCNHNDGHKIKNADIHIILALLTSSRSQLSSAESLWMPVCLPKFNQDAYLHSYISYTNDHRYCVVLMSIDREDFGNCQSARNSIEDKFDALFGDASQKAKLEYQVSPLVSPALLEMQDKLVSGSLTSEERAELEQKAQVGSMKQDHYHTRQLQFLWYQTNRQVFWWQRSQRQRLNPIMYYMTKKMLQASLKHLWLKISPDTTFLGWHMSSFQLYAQFDGTITTTVATEVIQRITNWIKREEDNFSIKDYR